MKKRLLIIPVIIAIFISFLLLSCGSSQIIATFSNVTYDSENMSVNFELEISDSKNAGSNYMLNIEKISNTNSSTYSAKKSIETLEKTSYSFDNLEASCSYTIFVTCDKDGSNVQIKNSHTFTTSASSNSSVSEILGLTYQETTLLYDGNSHITYATILFNNRTLTISSNYRITYKGVSYLLEYDSNNRQKNVGTYNQYLYIYSYPDKKLLETVTTTLTIAKAKTLYEFSDLEEEYDGKAKVMPFSYEGLTYAYYDSNNNILSEIINPGTYTVKYNFPGDDFFEPIHGTFTYTIEKAQLSTDLSSQTTVLDEFGKATYKISDEDFNIPNVKYTIKYYNSSNVLIDTPYITNVGTYTVVINIDETDFYEKFTLTVKLYVVNEMEENDLLVSNVEYFSINASGKTNNYIYFSIYNASVNEIDLSSVVIKINGEEIKLSGIISPFDNYKVLAYSNVAAITTFNLGGSVVYDFRTYAKESYKFDFQELNKIEIEYGNIKNEYLIEYSYADFYANLSNRENNTFTYHSLYSIKESVDAVNNFGYSIVAPTVNYDFTDTISISRINTLHENVNAVDALNNYIEISDDMVDTSQINLDNMNKNVTVTYNIYDIYGNVNNFKLSFLLVDEEAPNIELASDVKTHILINDNIDLTKYFNVYDDVDGVIEVTKEMIDDGGAGDFSVSGKYLIKLNVSDKAGNEATYTFSLYVNVDNTYLSSYVSSETIKTNDTGEGNAMPSTGNVKVLVVPIFFNEANATQTFIDTLNTVFNDTTDKLTFGSVKSYYNVSSYGKLNLSFDIFDNEYFIPSKSYKYYDTNMTSLISSALQTVDKYYNLADYDSDNDGYIDAIWFIYDMDYISGSNYYWAWTSDFSGNITNKYDEVNVGKIAFASYEFADANDSYYDAYPDKESASGLTARTYIHETGHLMGLSDYYDYDYDKTVGYHHTMFGMSLMDSNYGDLDSASKLLLGWIDPVVICQDDVVNIKSLSTTGDCVLIAKESNIGETIFNEYILLEFWNGDGLNEADVSYTFGENKYGIRVIHYDATINYVNGVATLTNGERPSYFKYNNTDDDSHNSVETLASNPDAVYDTKTHTYNVVDNVLFSDTNIVFGKDIWQDFVYNNGNELDFTFTINEINKDSATISISFQ